MGSFVCPECHLRTRPAALFLSRGKAWWSVAPAEASLYRALCHHREEWRDGVILGCASMRASIDSWLRSEPDAPLAVEQPISSRGGETSIAEVATASHIVEERADIFVPVAPVIGESFRDPRVRSAFQHNPGATEVKSFDLRDVVLDPSRLILLRDGRRIAETRYILSDDDYWREPAEPRVVHDIDTGKTIVLGANLAFRNYYHWLMQCLPAIDCSVRTVGAERCVLALPPLAAWQEETLAMLGYAELPRIEIDAGCHYRFRRLHYCTYLNGSAEDFLSPRCLDVIDRLKARTATIPDAPERIYVARLDTRNRPIANEEEIVRLLERHGFVTLVPGYFSFGAQIGLFRAARFIVGAHGAGLTNLAFCDAGATVLELIQSTYPILFMNRIAQARGLRYHAECFESEVNADVHRQDWIVDKTQLETKLLRLLESPDDIGLSRSRD